MLRLPSLLLATLALLACGDSGDTSNTTSTGDTTSSSSSGMGGAGGGDTTTSTTTTTSTSSTGGGGEGGGPPVTIGVPGTDFVNAGTVMTSPAYRLVITVGQSSPVQHVTTSPSYEMHGGIVGSTH